LCSISPQVIGSAQLEVSKSRASERVQWLTGDFFLDPLPEADLFAMSRILHDWRHDWREDKIDALLTKIYRRLPANGGILLVEKLLYEDKSGPTSPQMRSLNCWCAPKARNARQGNTGNC
jgi:acetylserotonin O-methyltransferase